MEEKKFKGNYGESEQKNFKVIDTIGVPHTYCITPKHLEYNNNEMYLNIEKAEERSKQAHPNDIRKQAICDICKHLFNKGKGQILPFSEHKQALLIECKEEIKENKELHEYLLKIKGECVKNGYVGFAFLKKEGD